LLLQSASFGAKPIWISQFGTNKWENCSFRNYWQPTLTSNRRSPVNPMMPMPETLLERAKLICKKMKGVIGIKTSACIMHPEENTVIYIDPPYKGRTKYMMDMDGIKWGKFFLEGQ